AGRRESRFDEAVDGTAVTHRAGDGVLLERQKTRGLAGPYPRQQPVSGSERVVDGAVGRAGGRDQGAGGHAGLAVFHPQGPCVVGELVRVEPAGAPHRPQASPSAGRRAATGSAKSRDLIVPRVLRSLPARSPTMRAARPGSSSSGAAASTRPAETASAEAYRRPVVIASIAVRGVSLLVISAVIPGVNGMVMSTSGKQK